MDAKEYWARLMSHKQVAAAIKEVVAEHDARMVARRRHLYVGRRSWPLWKIQAYRGRLGAWVLLTLRHTVIQVGWW